LIIIANKPTHNTKNFIYIYIYLYFGIYTTHLEDGFVSRTFSSFVGKSWGNVRLYKIATKCGLSKYLVVG